MQKFSLKTKIIAISLGVVTAIGTLIVIYGFMSKATVPPSSPIGDKGQKLMHRPVLYKDYNRNNPTNPGTKLGTYLGTGIAAWQRFDNGEPAGETGMSGIIYLKDNGKVRMLVPFKVLGASTYYVCGMAWIGNFTSWLCGDDFKNSPNTDYDDGGPYSDNPPQVSNIDIRYELEER